MSKRARKLSVSLKTFAFIDASNIIYGTRDEGWKVDFRKLFGYLTERYRCNKVYYFGGIEKDNHKQAEFYEILKKVGFCLVLKPVKIYRQLDGSTVRKANCDVDLTFYAMRDKEKFKRIIFFSGDGDFEVLLKYFTEEGKKVVVFANARRTAKEIKRLKSIQFNDLGVLRGALELLKNRKRR